jgi:hypothetical protein
VYWGLLRITSPCISRVDTEHNRIHDVMDTWKPSVLRLQSDAVGKLA